MDLSEFHTPTTGEIDALIHAAHVARAAALRDMVQSAARWLAHPHLKARTA